MNRNLFSLHIWIHCPFYLSFGDDFAIWKKSNSKLHCIQCVTSWHDQTIFFEFTVTNEIWVDNFFDLISLNMFIWICSYYYWYIIKTNSGIYLKYYMNFFINLFINFFKRVCFDLINYNGPTLHIHAIQSIINLDKLTARNRSFS